MNRLNHILLLFLFLSACKTTKVDLQHLENNGEVVLSMERTPCFGACPVYEVKLYANGLLLYNGKRYTQLPGKQYAVVSKKELAAITDFIVSNDFFNLENKYPVNGRAPSDLPSCIIYFKNKGVEKRIEDHSWETPANLTTIERKVDSLVATKQFFILDNDNAPAK